MRISLPQPIHFPKTTFCLFPPESCETDCSLPAHLIDNSLIWLSTYFFSLFFNTRKSFIANSLIPAIEILSSMLAFKHNDSTSLSFETYPSLFFIAFEGLSMIVPSLTETLPDSGFNAPKHTFPSECIPQCARPPIPTISPFLTWKDISLSLSP